MEAKYLEEGTLDRLREIFDYLSLAIFCLEAAGKLVALESAYFEDVYNCFDLSPDPPPPPATFLNNSRG